MRKHLLGVVILVLMMRITVYPQDIGIYMGNKNIRMDVTPQIKEDTAYAPISFILKELGAEVKWENPKVIITKGKDQIICTIGDKMAYKNGNQVKLTEAPYIFNSRTFLHLVDINELLDCNAEYQKENNRISIEFNSNGNSLQESDTNQIKNIAEKFAQAYFSKNLEDISLYLAPGASPKTYTENIWTDFSDFRLKWGSAKVLPREKSISVQFEFTRPGNDSYDYLDLSFSNASGEWWIGSFGIEK